MAEVAELPKRCRCDSAGELKAEWVECGDEVQASVACSRGCRPSEIARSLGMKLSKLIGSAELSLNGGKSANIEDAVFRETLRRATQDEQAARREGELEEEAKRLRGANRGQTQPRLPRGDTPPDDPPRGGNIVVKGGEGDMWLKRPGEYVVEVQGLTWRAKGDVYLGRVLTKNHIVIDARVVMGRYSGCRVRATFDLMDMDNVNRHPRLQRVIQLALGADEIDEDEQISLNELLVGKRFQARVEYPKHSNKPRELQHVKITAFLALLRPTRG